MAATVRISGLVLSVADDLSSLGRGQQTVISHAVADEIEVTCGAAFQHVDLSAFFGKRTAILNYRVIGGPVEIEYREPDGVHRIGVESLLAGEVATRAFPGAQRRIYLRDMQAGVAPSLATIASQDGDGFTLEGGDLFALEF